MQPYYNYQDSLIDMSANRQTFLVPLTGNPYGGDSWNPGWHGGHWHGGHGHWNGGHCGHWRDSETPHLYGRPDIDKENY